MPSVDLLGAVAGTLTTLAFIPQVIKTWRSGSAEDISLFMFLIFSIGVLFWLLYGIALDSWPMMLANGITLVLALSILGLKVRYTLQERRRLRAAGGRPL